MIRDLETGRGAVGSVSVIIPEITTSGMAVYPPLLLRSEKEGLYLNGSPTAFPFDTSRYVPVLEDVPEGVTDLQSVIHCEIPDVEDPDIRLSATLVDENTGIAIPLECSPVSTYRSSNARIIVCSLNLIGARPGRYLLRFYATEMTTNASAQAAAAITLK